MVLDKHRKEISMNISNYIVNPTLFTYITVILLLLFFFVFILCIRRIQVIIYVIGLVFFTICCIYVFHDSYVKYLKFQTAFTKYYKHYELNSDFNFIVDAATNDHVIHETTITDISTNKQYPAILVIDKERLSVVYKKDNTYQILTHVED